MPNIGSYAQRTRGQDAEETVFQSQNSATSQPPHPTSVPLEVGSIVEVVSKHGVTVYGVVRWLGILPGKTNEWAGVELVSISKLDSYVLRWLNSTLILVFVMIVSGLRCERLLRWGVWKPEVFHLPRQQGTVCSCHKVQPG